MKARLKIIGAILRKDFMALWPLAVITALVFGLGPFVLVANISDRPTPGQPDQVPKYLRTMLMYLPAIMGLLGTLTAFTVSHQDPGPGMRQDWLIRPVSKVDLIIAKYIFVFAVIFVPVLTFSYGSALYMGMPLLDPPLLAINMWPLLLLPLIVVAFASLTANLVEALVSVAALFVIAVTVGYFVAQRDHYVRTINIDWLVGSLIVIYGIVVTTVILWLQYVRRATMVSRILTAAAIATLIYVVATTPDSALAGMRRAAEPDHAAAERLVVSPIQLCRIPMPPRVAAEFSHEEVQRGRHAAEGPQTIDPVLDGHLEIGPAPAGWIMTASSTWGSAEYQDSPFGRRYSPRRINGAVFEPDSTEVQEVPPTPVPAGSIRYADQYALKQSVIDGGGSLTYNISVRLLKPGKPITVRMDGKRHWVRGLGICGPVHMRKARANREMYSCTLVGGYASHYEVRGKGGVLSFGQMAGGDAPAFMRRAPGYLTWSVRKSSAQREFTVTPYEFQGATSRKIVWTNTMIREAKTTCSPSLQRGSF